ncbi:hypothetical protein NHX12_024739 [Muraenolepis orangiensis]|uniref:Uncharacterized protein n=1 Tax=Muraenolepis orangiensis TaxID=630683 RepID=A0A9Q0EK01_9TELE|nr:hypothetical protein NHX12_024739 [Muraenolepis orangiensis]
MEKENSSEVTTLVVSGEQTDDRAQGLLPGRRGLTVGRLAVWVVVDDRLQTGRQGLGLAVERRSSIDLSHSCSAQTSSSSSVTQHPGPGDRPPDGGPGTSGDRHPDGGPGTSGLSSWVFPTTVT